MIAPEFIYFLQDDMYRSYYVQDGIVQLSTSGKPLEFSPAGWQEIALTNARNSKYFALDRSFSIPLSFVEDGAQIVKWLYYTKGFEAKVNLVICRRELYFSETEYGYYYKLFYKGELDMANFKHDGAKVTVNILEGGLVKDVKAFENVKYEIVIDAVEKVKLDGIYLTEKHNWITQTGLAAPKHLIGMLQTTKEGQSTGAASFTVYKQNLPGDLVNSTEYFYATTQAIDSVKLNGTITANPAGVHENYQLRLKSNLGRNDLLFTQPHTGAEFTFSFNHTFNAAADEHFYLVGEADTISVYNYSETNISLTFKARYKTTYVKGLTGIQLFRKLVEKIGNGKYTAESALLTNTFKNIIFTSGDAIRGIEGATIKTSLAEFFTAVNASLSSAGMGAHGNVLKLETKDFWIDHNDIIDIGNASSLKISTATEYVFNTLKVGYPEQKYDDVNGREEFNNTLLFTAPITRVTKELNLVSPYRADSYGIEFTRLNLEGKTTTDAQSDNDVFMLHVDPHIVYSSIAPHYVLDRTLNASAIGLIELETVYNIFLSPKRCLIRNGMFIHSSFFNQETLRLEFQSTEKNSKLTAGGIEETADVEIAGMGERFFVPIQFEFTAESPVNLIDLLDESPMKTIQFNYQGITLKMVPSKVSVEPSSNAAQSFTGLALATNDFTTLIDIYE